MIQFGLKLSNFILRFAIIISWHAKIKGERERETILSIGLFQSIESDLKLALEDELGPSGRYEDGVDDSDGARHSQWTGQRLLAG